MKRSPMPSRKTRLSPGVKQLRRAALNRSSELSRTAATRKPMVAKPAKRDPAEAGARKTVKARSLGLCELDGRAPATDMHHRRNRSQGGVWAPSNLLHLCHAHHMHITTHPRVSQEQGWSVPSHREPSQVPVWLARHGWVFLDDHGNYEHEIEESA